MKKDEVATAPESAVVAPEPSPEPDIEIAAPAPVSAPLRRSAFMSSPIAPQLVDPEPMVDPKVALTRVFDDALTSVQIITSAQYDANGGHYDLVSGSSHVLPAWLVEELVREGIGSRS